MSVNKSYDLQGAESRGCVKGFTELLTIDPF